MFEANVPVLDPPPPYRPSRRPSRGSEVVTGEDWAEFFPSAADQWIIQVGCEPIDEYTLVKLSQVSWSELSEAGKAERLSLEGKVAAYVEARRIEGRAALAGPEPASRRDRADDVAANEVALAERCSLNAAQSRVAMARDLATRLPGTAAALRAGRMLPEQARALWEGSYGLSDAAARELEGHLLRFCHRQDIGLFRKALRRWLPKVDPDWEEKAKAARADATVVMTPLGDGTGELFTRGPLEIIEGINRVLTAEAARTKPTLGGTADQRKLIALRDLVQRYLADPAAARQHGRLPEIQIVIDVKTLIGLRNGLAEIPGVGAIPADVVGWLLRDGAPLRRLITDPDDGHLLHYGTNTYLVPPPLADSLIATHVTSASPYSGVPARGCDMEHNTPADRGGATDPDNTTPVDRPWHRAKTHGDWTYRKDPTTKKVTWTAPTGQTITIDPYDYRI